MKKSICFLLSLIFVLSLGASAVFAQDIPADRQLPRLTDNADILSDSEEKSLLAKLDEISERQQVDVAVMTIPSLPDGYSSLEAFADDTYDYEGFGMGDGDDGMLLVMEMGGRKWHVTTHGFGVTTITDAGLEYLSDHFLPFFKEDNFADGFNDFAEQCDKFITQAKTGTPYDSGNLPKNIPWLKWIGISLVIGIAGAFFLTGRMKAKLKSVAFQKTAKSYLCKDSLVLDQSRDTFMYVTVARTEKPRESSSSGSSTHTSSSGRSHGGGGGSF